ncbi:ankyrin repeat domain-containing protein [Marinicella sp. W31]|uniref:ankyrin repeat domain-containing protein n=1 Tax=Marinicella sp. W31 TaxID=3023713 RepID=UPI0037573742
MNQHADDEHLSHLTQACRRGNLDLLKARLSDVSNHFWDSNNESLINIALRHGHWHIAEYLYKNVLIDEDPTLPAIIAAAQYGKDDAAGLKLVYGFNRNLDVTCNRGRTALMTACLRAHQKKAQFLIEHCKDINLSDETGMTALLEAASVQNLALIKLLTENGADINLCNQAGDNALIIAVNNKKPDVKVIRELMQRGADAVISNKAGRSAFTIAQQKDTPIFKAIQRFIHQEKQMELPLFAGQNMEDNRNKTIKITTPSKPLKILSSAVEAEWFDAAINNNLGRLHKLMQQDVDIDQTDAKGCTALIHAAGSGNRAICSFLLQNDADIEFRSNNGSTALSSAIMSNSRAVIELLMQRGADTNACGPGGYAYATLAAAQWNESSLSQLFEYKADLSVTDNNGTSLLHTTAMAAEYYTNVIKAKNTFQFLLNKGLDINCKDNDGNTPLLILCGAHRDKQYQVDDSRIANLAHELLKLGAHPDVVNKKGRSAKQFAQKHRLKNTLGVILSFLENW